MARNQKQRTTNDDATTTDKPKRKRGPNKSKAPQLDAQDYDVLLNHYDQAYTVARMDENVGNDELMSIYERLKKVRALVATPSLLQASQHFDEQPDGLE